MCYLLITKQIVDKPSKKAADKLRAVMLDQMKSNGDGFSMQRPIEKLEHRTLVEEDMIKTIENTDIDGTIFHARWASVGEVSDDNVHGYNYKGWTFSHNGGSSDYARKAGYSNKLGIYINPKKQDHTDSKLFFMDLVDEIETRRATGHKDVAKAIQAMLNEVTFWGRASLYEKKGDRLFLFGDWHTYNVDGQYIGISSADLGTSDTEEVNVRGLMFEKTKENVTLHGTLDNIVVIKNFSQPNWSLKFLMTDNNYDIEKKCNTTRVAAAYEREEKEEEDKAPHNNFKQPNLSVRTIPPKTGKYNFQDDDDDYYDCLFNILGDLVDVYYDETGVHDVMQECHKSGTCNMFFEDEDDATKAFLELSAPEDDAGIINAGVTCSLEDMNEEQKDLMLERLSH